ncbi:hypothetical protein [Ulvibacterium sp.]|uniref:hypothetical protein n=1 Tax=Ulvibacterium sp. TaxID=2665914 RepID=UPI0026139E9C|nr:hypothetical protein [Ulvibacterium sp.]
MNVPKQFKFILIGLGLLALTAMVYKINLLSKNRNTFQADESYHIAYRYFFKTATGGTFVKTYLPKNNARQQITAQKNRMPKAVQFSILADESNIRGNWSTKVENAYENVSYSFLFKGKSQIFELTKNFKPYPSDMERYLTATQNIQVAAIPIAQLAMDLKRGTTSDKETIKACSTMFTIFPPHPLLP